MGYNRPMPVGYQVIPAKRLVIVTYTDPVILEDWTNTIEAVFLHPEYEPGFNLLVDRRAAEPPTRAFADAVATFVRKRRTKFGSARIALLVSDIASYGMGRMQEMLNESADLPTRAFRSEAEAYAWLDVSAEDHSDTA